MAYCQSIGVERKILIDDGLQRLKPRVNFFYIKADQSYTEVCRTQTQ